MRTLIASANILAKRGQEQACEALLTATRDIYKGYVAEQHKVGLAMADVPRWRHLQITAANLVARSNTIFRCRLTDRHRRDQHVRRESWQRGGYRSESEDRRDCLSRDQSGGLFGIDEKYVPVPWKDFKATADTSLLVLGSTKGNMDATPQVREDQLGLSPSRVKR